jgi:dual specificity phosphatase 3
MSATTNFPTPPASTVGPAGWHRYPCEVTPGLILTGDLVNHPLHADQQLATWVDLGVTHIIDVREEACDQSFVAIRQPHLTYHWLGAHDNGGRQDDRWFDAGVDAALAAYAESNATVLVHCHMGINRGPSMGFAILCALGWDPIEALNTIRATRPIAAVLYAEDAISWWLRRSNASPQELAAGRQAVRQWLDDDDLDVGWVISRVRRNSYLEGN